jgi:purine-binding chemotaxis protein CheW
MSGPQLCTFRVADLHVGIVTDRVQEVVRKAEMSPIPLSEDGVAGLINLRGLIVTAIDLRQRLGLPPRADGVEPMHVVVRFEDGLVSLLVDGVTGVETMSSDDAERPPNTLREPLLRVVQQVYKLENYLLMTIDSDGVIRPERAA